MNSNSKYLPIGTVCSIKDTNKLVMIVGYFSTVYNGNVKMYDYLGLSYPEGMLLSNKISFNHSDITKILYNGYEDKSYINLNNILNNQVSSSGENYIKSDLFKNIKFDSNGVVIYDSLENDSTPDNNTLSTKNNNEMKDSINNPFFEKYEEKKLNDDNQKEWPIFKNIQFDENGVVISAEEN